MPEKRVNILRSISQKRYELLLFAASIYATALAAQEILHERSIPDLARAGSESSEILLKHWKQGNVVVLVRHVERCDHSDAPCLNDANGITERAVEVAQRLGSDFKSMGLEETDIYSSSLTRAVQTSAYMFNADVPRLDWLFDCKEGFRNQIAQQKRAHRNLILVTHSECMNRLEESLELPSYRTPKYGASLFLKLADPQMEPEMVGILNASDWSDLLSELDGRRFPTHSFRQ
ncbi:hypothetical protein THL1_4629 [Pseudomonas sp. TCU-HL1]|nr:hypothetical protein THL1_4629 [Pseudomonas sp. TCU-HL1]